MPVKKFISYENMQRIAEILSAKFDKKSDKNETYTKAEVDDLLSALGGGITDDSGNISLNTAGATNNTNKLFLIGAQTQGEAPQTYSRNTAYIGTDGCLYSNSKKVLVDDKNLNATTGYYSIIDGMQIRWGHYTGSLTNYQFTVTFDVPFPNGCLYADIMNGARDTMNTKGLVSIISKSATSVTFGLPQSGQAPYWIAFGY